MVGRPSRKFGCGQEILLKVQKWLGDPYGGPEVVGTPSRSSGSGRETLPEVRKWLADPPGVPVVVV